MGDKATHTRPLTAIRATWGTDAHGLRGEPPTAAKEHRIRSGLALGRFPESRLHDEPEGESIEMKTLMGKEILGKGAKARTGAEAEERETEQCLPEARRTGPGTGGDVKRTETAEMRSV